MIDNIVSLIIKSKKHHGEIEEYNRWIERKSNY